MIWYISACARALETFSCGRAHNQKAADVWKKDVWEFQASGSSCLFPYFLGKIAVQEMSGKTPGSPRHPSSRHPRTPNTRVIAVHMSPTMKYFSIENLIPNWKLDFVQCCTSRSFFFSIFECSGKIRELGGKSAEESSPIVRMRYNKMLLDRAVANMFVCFGSMCIRK